MAARTERPREVSQTATEALGDDFDPTPSPLPPFPPIPRNLCAEAGGCPEPAYADGLCLLSTLLRGVEKLLLIKYVIKSKMGG
jgi:hypothetical protein